jgi:prepilin-type processing-associated H-X9-DG protein
MMHHVWNPGLAWRALWALLVVAGAGGALPQARSAEPFEAAMRDSAFREAYQCFLSFDHAAAATAFDGLRARGAESPVGLRAQYFLAVSHFARTRFKTAAQEAATLAEWMALRDPAAAHVRVRRAVNPGATADRSALRAAVLAHSAMRQRFEGEPDAPELGVYETLQVLDVLDLLARLLPTAVYAQARERLAAPLAEDAPAAAGDLRENLRVNVGILEPTDDARVTEAILTLALYAPALTGANADLANVLGQAACAHQLRQIGIAFHLYLLDHDAVFPPCRMTPGTPEQEEEDWVVGLMPYLGFEREILPTKSWSGKPDLLAVNPPLFLCPGRTSHPWGTFRTRGGEYGYNTYLEPSGAGKTPVKYADITPDRQVLIAETEGSNRFNSPAAFFTPHRGHGNVLYADGTVRTHDADWAQQHGWYARPGPDNPWKTASKRD